MRIVFWGTYDTGKPRVRILLRGLRENDVEVIECHKEVWGGIEDKSQLKGAARKLRLLFNWLLAYPILIWQYLRLPKHDAVVVGYLGQLDVLVLWPFAKLRGIPIIWDAFLSLYNTVVEDRQMVDPHNPLAWLLWAWEWLAAKAADLVVLDTQTHGNYFIETFGIQPKKVVSVFVGAEPDIFDKCRPVSADFQDAISESGHTDTFNPENDIAAHINQKSKILFYGQFIPLHGIDTVVQAAKLTEKEGMSWIIVGTGQESRRIRELVAQLSPSNLKWIEWIPYDQLVNAIREANVCLGIFGATDKASRVIPNKAFQILMCGKPLITRDSPAIRELIAPESVGIWLIPPADPAALANAVRTAINSFLPKVLHDELHGKITPIEIARSLLTHMQTLIVKTT